MSRSDRLTVYVLGAMCMWFAVAAPALSAAPGAAARPAEPRSAPGPTDRLTRLAQRQIGRPAPGPTDPARRSTSSDSPRVRASAPPPPHVTPAAHAAGSPSGVETESEGGAGPLNDDHRAGPVRSSGFNEHRPLLAATVDDDATSESDNEATSTTVSVVNTLGALAVVVGLIYLMRALYTRVTGQQLAARAGGVGFGGIVEVLGRVAVAPRSHLLLVRVGQRVLMLGESPGGMSTLGEIHEPDEIAEILKVAAATRSGSISRSFSQLLGRVSNQYDVSQRSVDEGVDASEYGSDRIRNELSSLLAQVRSMSRGRAA